MIIDRGSYANVVSLCMIEKLSLQAMTHPHPYNIQWFNQSRGYKLTPGASFLSPMERTTRMSYGVMLSPRMHAC